MPVSSRAGVDFILLGPTHDRRQLQDSPVLGDVWSEFAKHPAAAVDLLVSPFKTKGAGRVGDRTGQGARATGEEPRYTHQARLSPADNSLWAFFAAHPDMARASAWSMRMPRT